MNPQRTFPTMADLRWSKSLQAKYCNYYTRMHFKANTMTKIVARIPYYVSFSFRCHDPWLIGKRTKDISSVCSVLNYLGTTPQDGFPSGACSDLLKAIPVSKKQIFNRMYGWPGTLPGNRMPKLSNQRITTYLTRSAGDIIGVGALSRDYIYKPIKSTSRHLYPPGKESKFNRINGSPGDPPGNRMHRVINHRIVPEITRLAGDPIGKEAGRETTIGDTKHVNQYIN
jgi:hypothetical protein